MEWISVKDRLPEFNKEVLMYSPDDYFDCGNGYIVTGMVVDANTYRGRGENDIKLYGVPDGCTHWMPLPEPPKD